MGKLAVACISFQKNIAQQPPALKMEGMVWTTTGSPQELLKVQFGHENGNYKIFSMAGSLTKIVWRDARSNLHQESCLR